MITVSRFCGGRGKNRSISSRHYTRQDVCFDDDALHSSKKQNLGTWEGYAPSNTASKKRDLEGTDPLFKLACDAPLPENSVLATYDSGVKVVLNEKSYFKLSIHNVCCCVSLTGAN